MNQIRFTAAFFVATAIIFSQPLFVYAANITSWAELDDMRNSLSGTYTLTADLNQSSPGYDTYASSAANSGSGWSPVGTSGSPFTGSFDGGNHIISGLYINRAATSYVGLFGRVSGSNIKNVSIENGFVKGSNQVGGLTGSMVSGASLTNVHYGGHVQGATNSGGLVGWAESTGSNFIQQSTTSATVTGTGASATAALGGFIGLANNVTISNSYASSTVVAGANGRAGGFVGTLGTFAVIASSSASTTITASLGSTGGFAGIIQQGGVASTTFARGTLTTSGGSTYGGFAGNFVQASFVYDSFAAVRVTTAGTAGAFFGSLSSSGGTVKNSYAVGNISATSNTGGFFGSYSPGGANTLTGLVWDTQSTGRSSMAASGDTSALTSANVEGFDTPTMNTESTFTGKAWDFTNVWGISSYFNDGYPFFLWQGRAPSVTTDIAYSIEKTSASLDGTIDDVGSQDVTVRGFQYGLTTSYGSTAPESGSFSTGSFAGALSSLTCNSTYHYRAFATNSVGTSYGNDATFTTSACPVVAQTSTTVSSGGGTVLGLIGSTGPYMGAGSGYVAPRPQIIYPDGRVVYLDEAPSTPAPQTNITSNDKKNTLCPSYTFKRTLRLGNQGEDVQALQKFLNCAGFSLAASGPGSIGNETIYYSARTKAAVEAFHVAYKDDILVPTGSVAPTGIFGSYSRQKAVALMQK